MGVRKKKKLGFIGKAVLMINILLAGMLLVSYLTPFIDPRVFWPAAFFGLAYPPLLLINACFIVLWLFWPGRRALASLSFIAIICGWGALQSHIGLRWPTQREAIEKSASDTSQDTSHIALKVLTYNVHLFRQFNQSSSVPNIKDAAISLIGDVNPDIVCLQEYYTRKKGEHDVSEAFKNTLGLQHKYLHATAENEYESYGLAIFSKYPILASGHLPDFERGVNSIIFADIAVNDRIIRVYNVHLRSYGFQKEDYDFIAAPRSEETLESQLSSTRRIGGRLKQAFELRSQQARSLRKHLEANDIPFIVMGDFNDTPLSFAFNHVQKGLKNTFRERAVGWGATYNGDFPNFQIDYILTSPEFQVAHYEIIREKLSDHYPVWSQLYLP